MPSIIEHKTERYLLFQTIESLMKARSADHYKNEVLPFLFREFRDLKYVMDPEHEISIICSTISNLIAYSICTHGSYSDILWYNTYKMFPDEIEPLDNISFRNYAELIEGAIESFQGGYQNEFEIIRMILCYSKLKGYNFNEIFSNYFKKSSK